MKDIKQQSINTVASDNFLNYAIEVITERAIPSIEDNLKPVHRRILYTFNKTKLKSDAKAKKSAATVGEVMKIHPHGDLSIYDALIRLSQDFKMRYPLVNVQGNSGNINGSPAAAMRYTEAKLSPIGDLMVSELSENCVPFVESYDGDSKEPKLMPSMFPNILCNGNMGIAVGMSSALLPHNLKEVVDALIYLADNETMSIKQLLSFIPGPDFPTGGVVTNIEKIQEIYETGSGTIEVQGKYTIEDKGKETHIVFTEIPYLVQMETIISKIKELSEEGIINDVLNIQNNTGRSGVELRVIVKSKANINRILQILFDKTGLKNNIRAGFVVLENDIPIQTNMLGLLQGYLNHRHTVITNIYQHKHDKASARQHIVEGLLIAVQDIDNVIQYIKESSSRTEAREKLMSIYSLSTEQANAILDMKLSQLTKMDAYTLQDEAKTLAEDLLWFSKVITDKKSRAIIIKEQLNNLKDNYGDSRRTILDSLEITEDDLFEEENYAIALYEHGELEIINTKTMMNSTKGRVGKKYVEKTPKQLITFNNINNLLVMDINGRATIINGRLIMASNSTMLSYLDPRITEEVVYIKEVKPEHLLKDLFVTVSKNGTIKSTKLSEYGDFKAFNIAAKFRDGDEVAYIEFANSKDFVVVIGEDRINRYSLTEVRDSGKNTLGVKASGVELTGVAIGSSTDKVLLYDADGAAKFVIINDIPEGKRTVKGLVLNQNNIGIEKYNKSNLLLLSNDLKGYILDASEIDVKNYSHTNNKIYNGKLIKIGV